MDKRKIIGICEECEHYDVVWDDERDLGEKVCQADLDEDELRRFLEDPHTSCPMFKPYDEYQYVAKQN